MSALRAPRALRRGARPGAGRPSKAFTESVIVGELTTGALERRRLPARHLRDLGGTRVVWDALRRGEVDVYPEYTGTLSQEISAGEVRADALGPALAAEGLELGPSLGFEDGYALGMREESRRAARHPPHLGPPRPPRAALRLQQRVHGPGGRVARAPACLRAAADEGARAGARARLPRARAPVRSTWSTSTPPTRRSRPSGSACWRTTATTSPSTRRCSCYRADLERRVPGARAALQTLQGGSTPGR